MLVKTLQALYHGIRCALGYHENRVMWQPGYVTWDEKQPFLECVHCGHRREM